MIDTPFFLPCRSIDHLSIDIHLRPPTWPTRRCRVRWQPTQAAPCALAWEGEVDGRNPVSHLGTMGINYQPQLVQEFFHQLYHQVHGWIGAAFSLWRWVWCWFNRQKTWGMSIERLSGALKQDQVLSGEDRFCVVSKRWKDWLWS